MKQKQNIGIKLIEITEYLISYQNILNGSYYKKLFIKNDFKQNKSKDEYERQILNNLQSNLEVCIENVLDSFESDSLFKEWEKSDKKDHTKFLNQEKIENLPYGKNFIDWILDNYNHEEIHEEEPEESKIDEDEDTDGTGKVKINK